MSLPSHSRRALTIRWMFTCPACAHPDPGAHEHSEWAFDAVTNRPVLTGRMCSARAAGEVVQVNVAWPLHDDVVERAARKLAYEFGMEAEFDGLITETPYTPDHWRNVAREVLTAALTEVEC